jgi:hypothetical protein
MTNQLLIDKANVLIMHSYEYVNSVNCFGNIPLKNNSIEYLKAKKYLLKQLSNWKNKDLYNFVKQNY